MAAEKKFPLSLIIRAVDQASPALAAVTAKINQATGPLTGLGRNLSAFGEAANLSGFAEVGSALMNVGSTAFGLAAKFAGLAAGAGLAFGAVVKGAMDAGDSLGEHADRVGLGVDAYASLRFAAAQADVPAEMFAASLDKLNKQMGDMHAGKGGEFLAFLNEISPALAKQMKGAKTTEQGLALMTDALAKIPDTQRRATLSAHAFGKANMQMGEWLHGGSAAIHEQQAEFMRLFGSQEKAARAAGELDNATRKTETAFLGLRMAAAGALFPALTKVANVVTEFMVKHRDGIAAWAEKSGAAISAWVDGGGFDRLVKNLADVAGGIGKVIDFLGPMGTAAAVGVVAFAPLIASVGSLGASLVGVMPQIIAFVGWAGPPLVSALATAGTAIAGFGSTFVALAAPMAAILLPLTSLMMLGKAIHDNWDELGFLFRNFGETLKFSVMGAWEVVKPVLSAMAMVPGWGSMNRGIALVDERVQALAPGGNMLESSATAEAARPRAQNSSTNVSVSFDNLPAGARVSSESSGPPVSLELGYSVQP